MRAAYYERTGPAADVLQLAELPDPHPGPGEVRVQLHSSGVNPSDVKSRLGARSMPFPRVIPHSDGAGVIDEVGAGVPASRVGERVWVWNAAWGRPHGTAAEFVVLPAAQAVLLPDGVGMDQAACFGIPALTAIHAVRCHGGVRGQRVLVTGGAGAVGHDVIQFARLLGAAQVIATVSGPEKAQVAQGAGAHATINYRTQPVAETVLALTEGQGVDRVIDMDVAANATAALDSLRPGGAMVVYGSGGAEFKLPFFPLISRNLSLHFFIVYHLTRADRDQAEQVLAQALAQGALRPYVAERLPLSQIVRAHQQVESGQLLGNLVIDLTAG